jgi:hypothetical protein
MRAAMGMGTSIWVVGFGAGLCHWARVRICAHSGRPNLLLTAERMEFAR